MKKLILIFLLLCSPCYAQCTAEVLNVDLDPKDERIVVEAMYTLNNGEPMFYHHRYKEEKGKNQIIKKAKKDIDKHCKQMIRDQIKENKQYVKDEKKKIDKGKGEDILSNVEQGLIGYTTLEEEHETVYKNKKIKVKYDKDNTTTDN